MYDFFFQKSLKKRLERDNFDFEGYAALQEKKEALVAKRVTLEMERKALDVLGFDPEDLSMNSEE